MKQVIFSALFATITLFVAAQVPQAINYQAIARNSAGNPIANTPIGVRFKILQGSTTGTSVYTETQTATTNQVGLFNLQIGNGVVQSGAFATINWGSTTFYLEVAIDPSGGTTYQVLGTPSQFLSVPFALRALRNGTAITDGDGDTFIETDPVINSTTDNDQIYMHLGGSANQTPGVILPPSLILRRNRQVNGIVNANANTMLEIFDNGGGNNIFIGEKAGNLNTSIPGAINKGYNNTAVGGGAFISNTTGSSNSAMGSGALQNTTTGDENTAVGGNALASNLIGNYNTAIGSEALRTNSNGNYNTAIGKNSLFANGSGEFNTAVGYSALSSNSYSSTLQQYGKFNTAVGSNALTANLGGQKNTAVGDGALSSNIDGSKNTAMGENALGSNNGNSRSTAIGYSAMSNVDNRATGRETFNTAVGFEALKGGSVIPSNNTGKGNTAIGDRTLFSTTTGSNNTAVGLAALNANSTGQANTASGVLAMNLNTSGDYNTVYGAFAMQNNLTGGANTAIGVGALGNNVSGFNNTATGVNALEKATGSNNTANGYYALRANTADFNTAMGSNALEMNTSGFENTAMGIFALNLNVVGNNNTAIGAKALLNNTASNNTANGAHALEINTTGASNTAMGVLALNMNNGRENTSIGALALQNNTTGSSNTATGKSALNANVIGSANTADGVEALVVYTGAENTATGFHSLFANTTGSSNAAIGFGALSANITGKNNSALGAGANVAVGNLQNATAIGAGAQADASDQIRLGNSAVNEVLPGRDCNSTPPPNPTYSGVSLGSRLWKWKEVWACNGMIQPSDSRLKTKISNINYGLNAVMAMRPVQYFWKASPDNDQMLGFIAQEIEKIVPESVVAPTKDGEYYAMKYDALIPVLTKAIQEQQAQIEDLKKQNEQLGILLRQNQSLQSQIDGLRADVQSFRKHLSGTSTE